MKIINGGVQLSCYAVDFQLNIRIGQVGMIDIFDCHLNHPPVNDLFRL